MERGVIQGLVAFRWAAWVWMVVVLVVSRDGVARPGIAIAAAAAALAVTAAATAVGHADRDVLRSNGAVLVELTVALALVVLDGVVAAHGAAFSTRQSLGSVWPLASVLAAGVAWGRRRGALAGAVMGTGRVAAVLINGATLDQSGRVLSLVNSVVFYALAGAVAGHVVDLLSRAERDISAARARDEVARTLHDGVLQTLAVVERRADDPELARLAREQERELRQFLFGALPHDPGTAGRDRGGSGGHLANGLRQLAARYEDRFDGRVSVVVADDTPPVAAATAVAVLGAVGEALTNAGKHGGAGAVTVYVEPQDDGLFCSVRDDGAGFDPAAVVEGVGLTRSVRGRMEEIGGRADIRSRPGEGVEVCLWAP